MGRWPEGARRRLQEAALALFVERGYAATPVDAIAERAGVSQRTFFRHFRDKEEVLFDPDERLLAGLLGPLGAAPEGATPRELVTAALRGLARELGTDRTHLRLRTAVIASDIALQGRDLAKQARWTAAVATGLTERGVPPSTAALLADAAAAAFRTAYTAWLADPAGDDLDGRLVRALDDLAAALR